MSSSVKKIGSKYLVHVDILKAFRAELEKLPPKEKILFDFKSAVDFLRPFLELAVEKNTKDEIFELMGKVGWRITRNKFKQFWSFYLLEDENFGKKKNHAKKSSEKIKSETSNENSQKEKSDLSYDFSNDENEIKDSNVDVQEFNTETNLLQENTEEKHGAKKFSSVKNWLSGNPYFSVIPDTEDL